jgi:serine/threonine protein kinase
MELLKGETLAAALRRGPLGAGHAARIAWQIADAMVAVHAAGTVHRDLKPDNVFLSDGGATAKLLDFGIARVAGSEATETGTMMGTPDYVAPEQARSARRADARADVYAFGVMLFEMTTGRLPFAGATVYEVLRRHVECAPPLPSRHAPIPAELERLILRCLEKDPALRPSMPELRRLLRPHWQDAPAAPAVEEVTAVSTSRHARGLAVTVASSRRRRRARLLLGALLVAWLTAALIGSILAAG